MKEITGEIYNILCEYRQNPACSKEEKREKLLKISPLLRKLPKKNKMISVIKLSIVESLRKGHAKEAWEKWMQDAVNAIDDMLKKNG